MLFVSLMNVNSIDLKLTNDLIIDASCKKYKSIATLSQFNQEVSFKL